MIPGAFWIGSGSILVNRLYTPAGITDVPWRSMPTTFPLDPVTSNPLARPPDPTVCTTTGEPSIAMENCIEDTSDDERLQSMQHAMACALNETCT
eukprot:scaffold765_cov345-Prasinococcus_capsulatus_cf.AAC.13